VDKGHKASLLESLNIGVSASKECNNVGSTTLFIIRKEAAKNNF
jgi:hypothetical protein